MTTKQDRIYYYQVILKETQNELDHDSCANYPNEAGHKDYTDCVAAETRRRIMPLLGCMPPWLSYESICTEPISMKPAYKSLTNWLVLLYQRSKTGFFYDSNTCALPCNQISVKTVLQAVLQI